jgi:hypothetical protein
MIQLSLAILIHILEEVYVSGINKETELIIGELRNRRGAN